MEEVKQEGVKQEQPKEKKITNPKDLTKILLDMLLPKKEKVLSYADVASLLTKAFVDFEDNVDKNSASPLYKDNLAKASPEFAYRITLFSALTNALAALAYHCSPEEAKKIEELLK